MKLVDHIDQNQAAVLLIQMVHDSLLSSGPAELKRQFGNVADHHAPTFK